MFMKLKISKLNISLCAAFLVLAGIAVVLVGCGDTSAPPVSSASPTAAVQSTPLSQTTTQVIPAVTSTTPSPSQVVPTITSTTPSPSQVVPTITSATPSPSQVVSSSIVIDHTNWNQYNGQSQALFQNVAKLKIFFAHASVGGNILEGLRDLNDADHVKYPLRQSGAEGTPPATTTPGTIYEYDRGNPPWSEKISNFETYLRNGWISPKVDIVMNKFCYIDPAADWMVYRNSMLALEANYSNTKFIYWTMPLTTNSDSDEALRFQFNQNLRNWIATQKNKILFDLADIEAWTPDGQHQTFIQKGVNIEKLFSGYSSDGGHLNSDGMIRTATALYSLLGNITK
jgi:hypothetical protein